ncbi:NTF2 fold immunity protein [Pseudomonas putida]|uniref:NTF2 fold immunity protein domain-containing protein n=1 Tax=Pseudomonas putida TaxID=303 RepID=A0A6I6Y9D4_PSEPU|nr:NTF2 fold immunity protein [Pseudomonas putida]QHG68219.2 hypothetical protein C2H86_11080 [Pseudomonas putida]
MSIQNVPESLIAFMGEMKVWEVDFFAKRKLTLGEGVDKVGLKEEYAHELERILNKYAMKDKFNYGRLIDLGCTKPATYDPDSDRFEILESDEKNLTVRVQQVNGAETISRIYMAQKEGEWKIKKREVLNFDEKWRRAPL